MLKSVSLLKTNASEMIDKRCKLLIVNETSRLHYR